MPVEVTGWSGSERDLFVHDDLVLEQSEAPAPCLRTALAICPSILITLARRSSPLVAQLRRLNTLFCSRQKNDLMAVWSPAAPTRPIDPAFPSQVRARCIFRLGNCDPRSVCNTRLAPLLCRITALFSDRNASPDCIRASIDYPTIRLENTSFTAHR